MTSLATLNHALETGTHSVMIDGIAQRYHVAGTGPICLVHSGGPGVDWEYLRLPQLEAQLTLVYIEPIGTGLSGRLADPREYTLTRYGRCVDGLIAHLEAGPVYFLGHSHGGFVGLRYALDYPEHLAGLIQYDSSPTSGQEFWREVVQGVERFAANHAEQPEMADIAAAFQMLDAGSTDEEFTRLFRRILPVYFADFWGRQEEFSRLRDAVRAFIDPQQGEEPIPYDLRAELGEIDVRTLVIVGQHDVICAPRWSRLLAAGLPRAELVILDNSGHFGHIEEPERFAQAVINFTR
jgi:proline iminopeptidase